MRINRDRFVRSLTTRDARSLQSDREMNWNEEWENWAKEEREKERERKMEMKWTHKWEHVLHFVLRSLSAQTQTHTAHFESWTRQLSLNARKAHLLTNTHTINGSEKKEADSFVPMKKRAHFFAYFDQQTHIASAAVNARCWCHLAQSQCSLYGSAFFFICKPT